MKRWLLFSAVLVLFYFSNVNAEEGLDFIDRIDLIKIHVQSRKIEIVKIEDDRSIIKFYRAATVSRKKEDSIPYGEMMKIGKVTLNPVYYPTEENRIKHNLPKIILPGDRRNALGKIKFYFLSNGHYNNLGIHHTNRVKSIGARTTDGCVRLGEKSSFEIAGLIFEQEGYNSEELFKKAQQNRILPISIKLQDGPSVIFLRD